MDHDNQSLSQKLIAEMEKLQKEVKTSFRNTDRIFERLNVRREELAEVINSLRGRLSARQRAEVDIRQAAALQTSAEVTRTGRPLKARLKPQLMAKV